eukprot:scaffold86_cov338-Pavlova_lutheri.AAC.99
MDVDAVGAGEFLFDVRSAASRSHERPGTSVDPFRRSFARQGRLPAHLLRTVHHAHPHRVRAQHAIVL